MATIGQHAGYAMDNMPARASRPRGEENSARGRAARRTTVGAIRRPRIRFLLVVGRQPRSYPSTSLVWSSQLSRFRLEVGVLPRENVSYQLAVVATPRWDGLLISTTEGKCLTVFSIGGYVSTDAQFYP